jgi:hypothetical protein
MTQTDEEKRASAARYEEGLARVRWTQDLLQLYRELLARPTMRGQGELVLRLTAAQCAPLALWQAQTGIRPEIPLPLLGPLVRVWPWVRRAELRPLQLVLLA